MIDRLLSRREVEAICSLSRSSLYAMMAKGQFPKPARLSARRVAWRESDIKVWIDSRQSAGQTLVD
jgi:prophage regulatory protein